MSDTDFQRRMKANMNQLLRLKQYTNANKPQNNKHHPKSSNLPDIKIKRLDITIEDDKAELQLIKDIFLDNDESKIETLAKHLNVKLSSKQQVIALYRNKPPKRTCFRLDNRNGNIRISYRCGYFYNLDESEKKIINYGMESTPAILEKNIYTARQLRSQHISNSINVLSCEPLQPDSITIHIPKR
ncbi:hypothetical protein CsNV_061 [Callinectes sapidus nudivirus]|nr:hypothetical protein CsNV_061 [Callinectes sapidus nudivirus]